MNKDYTRFFDSNGDIVPHVEDDIRTGGFRTTPQPACYIKPLGKRATLASLNPDTNALDLVRGDRHFSLTPDELDEFHDWLDRLHPMSHAPGCGCLRCKDIAPDNEAYPIGTPRKGWHEWDCACAECMEDMFGNK